MHLIVAWVFSLTECQEGKEVAIAFASRLLTVQEQKFSTTEKECFALLFGVKTFRPYLEGYYFKAITDHPLDGYLPLRNRPDA